VDDGATLFSVKLELIALGSAVLLNVNLSQSRSLHVDIRPK